MPVVLELAAGPGLDHDVLGLVRRSCASVMVDAEALVVVDVVRGAAAEPDDQPALADVVEKGHLLGEADRVMQSGLDDRKADLLRCVAAASAPAKVIGST